MIRSISREQLYHHHHLSHQQIDDFLGEKESGKYPELKGQLLGKVNDFMEVSRLLTDEGIQFTPLKGPILSYRIYSDPSYRYFSDLDLLMDVEELKKGLDVLQKKGYIPQLYDWPSNQNKEKRLIARDNQFLLHHPEKNIGIELHWRPFKYEIASSDVIENVIKENKESLKYSGIEFKVFNKELELLYLIIHGGLHAWMWLKWLIDIKDFLAVSPPDPDKFTDLADKLNAGRMVALCNAMLKELFPDTALLPQKEDVRKKLFHTALREISSPSDMKRDIISRFRFSYGYRSQCFPGFTYRKSIIKHMMHSP